MGQDRGETDEQISAVVPVYPRSGICGSRPVDCIQEVPPGALPVATSAFLVAVYSIDVTPIVRFRRTTP
jgi:hypothetical protein